MRLLLTVILSVFLFSLPVFGQTEKPQTIIVPTGSLGNISEVRKKMLEKTLESTLDDHFAIVPKDLFEEAQEKAFEELNYDECTEEQCIMMIKEILQVENAFQLVLMEEDGDTQISLTWNDLDQKRVEEEYCEGCKTKQLRKYVAMLVDKLINKVEIPHEKDNQISSNEITNDSKNINDFDEIKKEYNSIYSSGDTRLLINFINKHKSNDGAWWYIERVKNKLSEFQNESITDNNNINDFDEIKKEYNSIYSSGDIGLLKNFINKYKSNDDAWWYIERVKNKLLSQQINSNFTKSNINKYFSYFVVYQNHTYALTNSCVTWSIVKNLSKEFNSYPVKIEENEENEFIANYFYKQLNEKINKVSEYSLRIGLTDLSIEGDWRWFDNSKPLFTNWAPSEPNNYNLNEDFAEMIFKNSNPNKKLGTWNDGPGTSELHHCVITIFEWDYRVSY